LMFVDQMRYDAMGCAGNPVVQTPALDRIAREGVHFTHGLTPSPVCIAARQSLITGHNCATHGRFANNVVDPEPLLYTVPQLLGNAGYITHAIGKMHFRPPRRHYGFHRMELMEEIPHYREDDEYLMYLERNGYGHIRQVHGVRNLLYHQPQVSVIPEEHHGSTWVADRTIDFLTDHARYYQDRPFFLWSSWIAPHLPWNAPEPFASMYPANQVDAPYAWDQPLETLPPSLRRNKQTADLAFASEEHLRRIRALYYGNVSLIDKGVGRILRALDALGMAENTLIVFTSDHGDLLGDHGLMQKSKPYEASVRVPFLLRYPQRIEAGRRTDERVTLRDLMPTFLDAASIEYPGTPALPGASLLGRSGGGMAEPRDTCVVEEGLGPSRWLSIMRGPWKYNYYMRGGWEELFNLEEDPRELHNLFLEDPTAQARQVGGDLRQRLTEWERQNGFPSSFGEDGDLLRAPVEDSRGRGDSTAGRPLTTNNQFPTWVVNLPADELARIESVGESVLNAMKHEWTYTLSDLNLAAYKRAGGTFEGTTAQRLLDEL
ncbi:MAG TPA: sulfatase-like hydrolase/transferase, partial [Chloroflexota bacterium]|nr:sulfatase-like hydrolase/transferase [Chloroflexota bacterium]